jgi:hypothetical protein
MNTVPWWIEQWCRENGWTEPFWVEDPFALFGGHWWAFPPLAVMAVPIDPFGVEAALKNLDSAFGQIEQHFDRTFEEVDHYVAPWLDGVEDLCRSLGRAWGIDDWLDG